MAKSIRTAAQFLFILAKYQSFVKILLEANSKGTVFILNIEIL